MKIQSRKDKDLIYKKIAEVLTVYDDVFSEDNNSPKMIFWLKKSIGSVLKLYHLI